MARAVKSHQQRPSVRILRQLASIRDTAQVSGRIRFPRSARRTTSLAAFPRPTGSWLVAIALPIAAELVATSAIGVGGSKLPPKRRGSGLRQSRKSDAERRAEAAFRQEVCSYGCFFAAHRPGHVCQGRLQAHHLLPKRAIRNELRGEPEARLIEILYAPVIGAPLCAHAHHLVEMRREYIWWDELTQACIEFCKQIGMEGRLRLACPEREEGD